jgi:putative two-component system response regulator
MSGKLQYKDSCTREHVGHSVRLMSIFVSELRRRDIYSDYLHKCNLVAISLAARMHDVGKIFVDKSIINKPATLSSEEFEEVKKHTILGRSIVRRLRRMSQRDPLTERVYDHAELTAWAHHEKWDGTGYPRGLSGEDIPLEGRIMAPVDVYDALIMDRPYKNAMTHEDALGIIMEGRGFHFDPHLSDAFVYAAERFAEERPQ